MAQGTETLGGAPSPVEEGCSGCRRRRRRLFKTVPREVRPDLGSRRRRRLCRLRVCARVCVCVCVVCARRARDRRGSERARE
jgi:hypothetical protein